MVTARGIAENLISNAIWGGLGLLVAGVAIVFTRLTPALEQFAPLSYLFAVLAALTLFAIAAYFGVRAWRHYHPLSQSGGDKVAIRLPTENAKLREEIDGLKELVATIGERAQAGANEAMRAHARIGLLEKELAAQDEARRNGLSSVTTEINEIRRNCGALAQEVKANNDGSLISFAALRNRERLNDVREKIAQVVADMERRVQAGERHDSASWDSWDNNHAHWADLMIEWWSVARFYVAAPRNVFAVTDAQYKSAEIPEELFLNGEGMRVFRQYRVIQAQWEHAQPELQQNVELVAFSGMTEQQVRNGAPVEQVGPRLR
jgi:hypothetical protein